MTESTRDVVERKRAQSRVMHAIVFSLAMRPGCERAANVVSLEAKKLDAEIAAIEKAGELK